MRISMLLLITLLAGLVSTDTAAGVLTSRDQLLALIGTSTTDNFEALDVPTGMTVGTSLTQLDHTTMIGLQGPNLVNPGCTYYFIGGPLTWLGAGFGSMPSKSIVTWNAADPQTIGASALEAPVPGRGADPANTQTFFAVYIAYDTPQQAVGVDLLRWDVVSLISMEVYDVDGNLLESVDYQLPDVGVPVFAGYEYDPGISGIVLKHQQFPVHYSPVVDNHTYGLLDHPTPTQKVTWGAVKKIFH